MKDDSPPTGDAAVRCYREATEWLLKFNDEQISEAELADWLRWCEQDGENLRAFERMQADWNGIRALRVTARAAAESTVRRSRWNARMAALVAGLAVMLGASATMLYWWQQNDPMREIVATTSNKTATLPDGSSLTLRAQAAVRLSFDGAQRRLELQQGGAAYFKVQHDAARPFVVRAGDLVIQAIGTAFDVRREAEGTWVTVEEGKVRISAEGVAGGATQWIATAGESFEFKPSEHRVSLSRASVAKALRWRDGEFAYDKVPLGDVLRDINRYSTRKLRTADQATAKIPYSGTVFVRSIDDWLLALTSRYSLRAVAAEDGGIVLESTTSQ